MDTAHVEPDDSGPRTAPTGAAPTVQFVPVDPDDALLLGRYRLGRRLGAGGFATVYAAQDERLDRPVAVKVLARERVHQSRFEREARAAARLHHPGIVTLFEAAVDDEGAYLVSELVKGSTLDHALAAGELSDREILEVGVALADALAHAHANDVVHRDVKPQNVLIPSRRGSRGDDGLAPAKLTDFGVAQLVDGATLTRTGDVIGTAAYMSPEQAEGRPTGPASDLYSLALVIYEALTGVNPVADLLRHGRSRRLGAYLPPLRRQRSDLPRTLGIAIDQALRPRPSERGNVADLRRSLSEARPLVDDSPGVVAPARVLAPTRITADEAPAARPTRSRTRRGDRGSANEPEYGGAPRERRPVAIAPLRPRLAPRGLLLAGMALGAVALGAVGLAPAWPALVAQTIRGPVRRAALGAVGFAVIGLAGAIGRIDFLYRLHPISLGALEPVGAAAGIWAAAAALAPFLLRGRGQGRDLTMASLLSLASGLGVALAGPAHTTGLVAGTLVGWLIWGHRPLLGVISATVAARRLA